MQSYTNICHTLRSIGIIDPDKCINWAFNYPSPSTNLCTLNELWNKTHPELFQIHDSDNFHDSILKIGKEYLKHFNGDQK